MLCIADRVFKLWEYQVSHGQLLIRSPKSPATEASPERLTNVDLVFLGVEYMAVPKLLRGLEVNSASSNEHRELEAVLGKSLLEGEIRVLTSNNRRFLIVAASFAISENDWDIFESPFEFRSTFRRTSA